MRRSSCGSARVRAPTSAELTHLAHVIAHRVGRFLERQGLLERDAENSYLTYDETDDDPMIKLMKQRQALGLPADGSGDPGAVRAREEAEREEREKSAGEKKNE